MKQLVIVVALLGACGGGSKPATTTPPPTADGAMPGPCVDPAADFSKRYAADIAEEAGVDHAETEDLDGDGVADVSASTGLGFMVDNSVYIMRGTCGHFVGAVGSAIEEVMPERSHGLADLKVTDNASACEGAQCGCEAGYLVFKFDGTAYVKDAAASHPGVEKPCAEE